MKKNMLICLFIGLALMGCSSVKTISEGEQEALQLMKEKRQYYKKLDEEKAKQQRVLEKRKEEAKQQKLEAKEFEEKVDENPIMVEEIETKQEKIEKEKQEEERKVEMKRIKTMSPEEKLDYRMEKAQEQINVFLEKSKAARQEEVDNKEASLQLEKNFNEILGE